MADNSGFLVNFYKDQTSEVGLVEDLMNEVIDIYGHDVRYIPRGDSANIASSIFGEQQGANFDEGSYPVKIYIINVDRMQGDLDFMGKFGYELRAGNTFAISRKSFIKHVPPEVAERPREGDLLYVPVFNKIFEIKFVDDDPDFFQLGRSYLKPYYYSLSCEVFRFSQENFSTGVDQIDKVIQSQIAYTLALSLNTNGSGNYYRTETVYQGSSLATANVTGVVVDWAPTDSTLKVIHIIGEFSTSHGNVKGASSNTSRAIVTFDPLNSDITEIGFDDNKKLQDQANSFLNTTETNRFGTI